MAEDYDIGVAIKNIEDELIASMIRNLDHHRAEETKEGYNWSQWQVEQLAALEEYKKRNAKRYKDPFKDINNSIGPLIALQRQAGNASQEIAILNAIRKGAKISKPGRNAEMLGKFFKANDSKINALIKATTDDMKKAETAILRKADDDYRKVIFESQLYANTGASYAQAVDMATKAFLKVGIQCIEYSNGARHTLSDYADMAIKTASKRAYLTGEGEKNAEWGISTVIINKRGGNPCPKCLPFVGKVLIDDVWSGGSSEDGPYPLMSSAMAAGLYHPRCKDIHTTYFLGISAPPDDTYTIEELNDIEEQSKEEAKEQYLQRQLEGNERLSKYSLDPDNKKKYQARADEWNNKLVKCKNYAKININDVVNKINVQSDAESLIYSQQEVIEEMLKSPIGIKTAEHILDSDVIINFINETHNFSHRGDQYGNEIRIFLSNIPGKNIAAQTLIHEMTHYYYNIGHCQHAEAVCFAMEKMHIEKRDFLTREEWDKMVKLAVENYSELEWEVGGYGNFKQFNFIR